MSASAWRRVSSESERRISARVVDGDREGVVCPDDGVEHDRVLLLPERSDAEAGEEDERELRDDQQTLHAFQRRAGRDGRQLLSSIANFTCGPGARSVMSRRDAAPRLTQFLPRAA
jgi:hypothetical protein